MRKIIALLLICCSCGQSIAPVKGGKKVKEKKHITAQVTFYMVTGFMLGYCLTDEYIREK